MLITFSCPAYADITMFSNVAGQLLKMMGHSGTVPSALLAEDITAARERLETALDKANQLSQPSETEENEDGEPVISLSQRARPLIELLKAAEKAKCNIMWDSNQ